MHSKKFKIKKAIFVAAGFGTRFLPITKAVPKEMLPLIDKPIIQYLVEEVVSSGIEEIIFVTGRGKSAIENHFDASYELEKTLVEKGKIDLVKEVEAISQLAKFAYVRQPIQKGDGHALLCARPFVGDEPILVVFPDYILPSSNMTFERMLAAFELTGRPIIATDKVKMEDTHKYGVLEIEDSLDTNLEVKDSNSKILKIKSFVEKPKNNPPSNMINCGYAIIDKSIWNILERVETEHKSSVGDGEIRLADAFIEYLNNKGEIYAINNIATGYDCGSQIGFVKAILAFAIERNELKDELLEFLKDLLK